MESISIFGLGLSELALVVIAALMIMGPKGISSIKPFLKVAYKSYLGFMREVNSMQGTMDEMKTTVMEPIKEIQDEAEKELKGIEKDVMPNKATSDFIKNEVKRMMDKTKSEMVDVNKELKPGQQIQKGGQQLPQNGANMLQQANRPQLGAQNKFAGQSPASRPQFGEQNRFARQPSAMQNVRAQSSKTLEIQKESMAQATDITNIKPPEFKIPEIKPPEFNPPTEEEIEKSVISLETPIKKEQKPFKAEKVSTKIVSKTKESKSKVKMKEKEKAKNKPESKKSGSKKRR